MLRCATFLCAWLGFSLATAQEPDPAQDARVRILLLGDSISMGYHNTVAEMLGDAYHVVRPTRPNGKNFENCEGTTKGVQELERWLALEGGNWDVIHFNFGLHDLKRVHPETRRNSTDPSHPRQAELDTYIEQLTRIVDRLQQENARLIFATTTPVPEGVRPYRENTDVVKYNFAAFELMWVRGIEMNDLYSKVLLSLDEYQRPKDVHFTPEGSAFLGRCVVQSVLGKNALLLNAHAEEEPWKLNRESFIRKLENALENGMPTEGNEGIEDRERRQIAIDRQAAMTRRLLKQALAPAWGRIGERGEGDLVAMAGAAEKVRTLQREGYSIEHLLIDSRPGMRIPAHLYLPDPEKFPPPWAGVLVPCGHTYEGKSAHDYQRGGMHLARHGMAALVYDPLDQGERIQAPKDDDSRQQHWGTTSHNIVGGQSRLLGWSQGGLEAWDGMRCVDYLAGRPDIDAERLGICGQSGGGTQTAQLFAIDERLKAAAPACYITSLGALARTIGPQDDEQNLDGQARHQLDHGSYLLARTPAPFLICAAQDDFFSIEGTRETFRRVRAVYEAYGAADHAQLVVAEGGHQWGEVLVSATVAFLAKHLDDREIEVEWSNEVPMSPEEARVTPRGQVVWMEGERTIYDFIREHAQQLKLGRDERSGRSAFVPELMDGPMYEWEWSQVRRGSSSLRLVRRFAEMGATRTTSLWMDDAALVLMHGEDRRDENEESDPAPAWMLIGAGASTAARPAAAPGTVYFVDPVCSGDLTPTDRAWYGSFGPAGTDGAYGVLLGRSLLGRQVAQILAFAAQ
ncbi:MAG: hypothetical protein CMJ94_02915, partial [Planctomycetes bacterium]|nr:hypothetical protein [Planctomycetota bacterium]